MTKKRKKRRPLQQWERDIIQIVLDLLEELDKPKKWLASQFGIKPPGISPYFSGEISFKEKIPRLAVIFNRPESYFRGQKPNVEPTMLPFKNKVPLISWVRAGELHEPVDIYQAGFADEWIASNTTGENIFALRVIGNSMYPEYHEGDIIVVDPCCEPASGDEAIVKINDEVTFKQIHFYLNKIVLSPINKEGHETIEIARDDGFDIQIIGKVVELFRRK